jgi:hypothetical protein
LEREPEARYSSAGDLADDLERWLEGRPIVARRLAASVRLWRWSKRNPKFAGALAASIVLAMLNLLAVFAITHLLSIVGHARFTHHPVASVRVQDLGEVTTNLNAVTEATNVLDNSNATRDTPRISASGSDASAGTSPVQREKEL